MNLFLNTIPLLACWRGCEQKSYRSHSRQWRWPGEGGLKPCPGQEGLTHQNNLCTLAAHALQDVHQWGWVASAVEERSWIAWIFMWNFPILKCHLLSNLVTLTFCTLHVILAFPFLYSSFDWLTQSSLLTWLTQLTQVYVQIVLL